MFDFFTLDIDGTGIVGEKILAAYTYEGYKGCMPILGFVPELDICIGYEFREDKGYISDISDGQSKMLGITRGLRSMKYIELEKAVRWSEGMVAPKNLDFFLWLRKIRRIKLCAVSTGYSETLIG